MLMALMNTNFQSIIIFLALSIVIGNSAPSGNLTQAEDSARAETCGKDHLNPTVTNSSQQWYGSIKHKDSNTVFPALMISSRHLLASTEVFKGYEKFYQILIDVECSIKMGSLPVPKELLNRLEVEVAGTPAPFILRAYAVLFCDVKERIKNGFMSYPMILEVNQEYEGSPPCLWIDPRIHLEPSLDIHDTVNGTFVHHKIVVNHTEKPTHNFGDFLTVNSIKGETGGAFVEVMNGRTILLGIGGSNSKTASNPKWFYSLNLLRDALCHLVGVCRFTTVIVPEVTTTTSPKPSTTFLKPEAKPTTIAATPQPIALPTSAPSTAPGDPDPLEIPRQKILITTPETWKSQQIPNPRPEIDDDEEYGEYLALKKDGRKREILELSMISLIFVILLF
ncbi:hypothetical protein B9Z55_003011 [Caenorhabditis nigoni]|uniref:Peptidase S1 domain-containing protein n=1 Tax=Caenorhabditis nigoni TaxID=1611254 RepID=A0A2G5VN64_9PELO|nr:hypothetical protein B9Z55_003011 [Caenorhabditis nigoni]